jgi:glutathione peroxidase
MRGIIGWLMAGVVAMLPVVAAAQNDTAAPVAVEAAEAEAAMDETISIYEIPVKPMEWDKHSSPTLKPYAGKAMLIVNVASRCGNTPQYAPLEKLAQDYKDEGLVVLGFPCNQFGGQEPGTELQIMEFCTMTYGVSFPLYSKIEVNGEGQAPLYAWLTGEKSPYPGKITWNFEKFLIGRDGKIAARFTPRTKPDSPEVMEAIKKALAAPAPKS